MQIRKIVLKKVKVHNLKKIDLTLETNQLIVFTGVSGSGKSSLAFDTIYVEGQRRYIESLSTYARRHLGELSKPDAELIEGVSPTIAIEQKSSGRNPRSTVGTMTGIYDFLRVLYARVATPYCPISGEIVRAQSKESILNQILQLQKGGKLIFLSPYAKGKKGAFKEELNELLRKGFTRIRLDGNIVEIGEELSIDGKVAHDVDIVMDRVVLDSDNRPRISEAVTHALDEGKGTMSVFLPEKKEEFFFSQHAYAKSSGISYSALEPQDFSFNHPSGMCATCQGLGVIQEFILEKIIDPSLSIAKDCCKIASSYKTVRFGNIYNNLARIYDFDIDTPWNKLSAKAKKAFLYGNDEKWTRMFFIHPEKKSRWVDYVQWRGVLHEARERYVQATSDIYRNHMRELMEESICPDCKGARIKPYPAAARIGGKRIRDLTAMPTAACLAFFENLPLSSDELIIAEELVKEIKQRLQFLVHVGLHYLSLERTSPTLSGGESQRVRLASQIGSGLVGATYVLDEPSIGLHPRDNKKLIQSLIHLRNIGNTVIVVEHDEETICSADWIVDVGPFAGEKGGTIISSGNLQTLLSSKESITGAYLSGRESIPVPKKRRKKTKQQIEIEQASHHNLKKVNISIPLGLFVAITGVSGSGKSSLISDTLYPALSNELHHAKLPVGKCKSIKGIEGVDKVIAIDQTPIGRTPRSNPATYIKVFDAIRDLFSLLPESKAQGFDAGRFSFNVKEGSCPHCGGMGMLKLDMDFMEEEWITCHFCEGRRFDTKTLSVLYKGKSIHDVLEMSVREAHTFFQAVPQIQQKLDVLLRVGLDYLRLGQPSPTLSGGEAQRIKLAKELSRSASGHTIYLLDEPTTGLHFYDIAKLLDVLQELVTRGHTVLVIEHNMDLVKTADWVIDLGPEGGEEGGKIIGEGTPEHIAQKNTPTGIALQEMLNHKGAIVPLKKQTKAAPRLNDITVKGASQNNLKKIDASIPRNLITVCTGPSGSGKSSFAFETLYAEGQRRYIDSLSFYARQFVKQMPKPKVDEIDGLSAAIAIEQKNHAGSTRSTIGTMTETFDYLRVLYAHLGTPYSPETGKEIKTISKEFVVEKLLTLPKGIKIQILSPLQIKESFEHLKSTLQGQGFLRIRLNNHFYELDEEIPYDKSRKNTLFLVIDRLMIGPDSKKRIVDAVDTATTLSGGVLTVAKEDGDLFFNLSFADEETGKSYPPITPHTFSFNTEHGMCLDCMGLGFQYGADLARLPDLLRYTPIGILRLLWKEHLSSKVLSTVSNLLEKEGVDPHVPLKNLSNPALQLFFNGTPEESKGPFRWIGLNHVFAKLAKIGSSAIKQPLSTLLDQTTCLSCQGTRLNPLARNVRLNHLSISELCSLPIEEAARFIDSLTLTNQQKEFLQETLEQLKKRLHFLGLIGLGYLSLDRSAPSLSGGETQRIRLARQLGSSLSGCLYVLDEPTIGLHPHNNTLLNDALKRLRDLGNTLVLVEHDPLTISLADHILDFGPGAGKHGGHITASGTLSEILKNPDSLTGAYLSGRKKIPIPIKRRTSVETLSIVNASLHNLKKISAEFPIGVFSCLTGVSGSGKSTLLSDLIEPSVKIGLAQRQGQVSYLGAEVAGIGHFDKLIVLDQNPIGQTQRADVTTYVDLLSPLRHFYAALPAAKAKGLQPKHFSTNHRKGMCTTCFGLGTRTIPLQFLPPVKVSCEACRGYRLNPRSLEVLYQGKNLGEVLQMTVTEARSWFAALPKATRILETLIAVGLGYLQLGQEVATLSGGEAQRLRLSRELAKKATGKTLYLFDEPTVGLHSEDIQKLLPIFHALVDKGNTLIVIEHHLDIIANADWVIDLGPEGGKKGGYIIAEGTPEQIARSTQSHTAKFLQEHLDYPICKN